MNTRIKLLAVGLLFFAALNIARAQSDALNTRRLSLHEAVQMALKQNHAVRIAELKVEEKQHAKDVARSAYFPNVRNETRVFHLTDTQLIQIPAGSLRILSGTSIPEQSVTLNQGGLTLITSGTGLVPPLTQLITKIKPANQIARAEPDATRAIASKQRMLSR